MTRPDFDRIMKEKIFAKHPELRQMVPLKMDGHPAMSTIVGVAILHPGYIEATCVPVHDRALREEARPLIKQYAPSRVCNADAHGVLCLVWIQ